MKIFTVCICIPNSRMPTFLNVFLLQKKINAPKTFFFGVFMYEANNFIQTSQLLNCNFFLVFSELWVPNVIETFMLYC